MVLMLAFAALALLSVNEKSNAADGDPADTVFKNGRVLLFPDSGTKPMSDEVDFAQAVAVTDDKISFVGDDAGAEAQVGPDTKVVDLDGRMLMPGLGDGHLHGGTPPACDLKYEGGTEANVLATIKECLLRADQAPYLDSNYVLRGANFMGDGMLPKGTQLTRHMLDRLSKDPSEDEYGTGTTRPIRIGNMDYHKSYVNTKAITNAGITAATPDPNDGYIGRDSDGTPNGVFSDFNANWGPSPPAVPDGAYQGLLANLEEINSKGITSIFRPMGSAAQAKRLADDGKLTVRFNQGVAAAAIRGVTDESEIQDIIDGFNATRDQYDGYTNPASPGSVTVDTAKVFCDGVAETPGQTASMIKPYRKNVGTPENPVWVPGTWTGENPSCEDARLGFQMLDDAKWSIHVHAIGDRAVRVALDNFEAIEAENDEWDRRPAITHLQFVDDEDIPRFGEFGVIASMSQQWNQRDAWNVDGTEGYIAPDRMDRMYPTKGMLDGGSVISQGSDWPVTELVPWSSIEQAVTREGQVNPARAIYPGTQNIGDAITLAQAVKTSTIGVAYQLHQDDVNGSIEDGKLADMIVIDRDLFKLPGDVDQKLADAKKALTDAEAAVTATADEAKAASSAASSAAERSAAAAGKAKKAKANKAKAAKKAKKAAKKAKKAKGKKAKAKAKKAARKAKAAAKRANRAASKAASNATKARNAAAGAKKASDAAAAKADGAVSAVSAAKTAVTKAEEAVETAAAEHVKGVSDTKVLMTMVGGKVVSTDTADTLDVSDDE